MIKVKDGVQFAIIAPAGYAILEALKEASDALHTDLTITSACDGEHSGPEDPHHLGEAYDVRSHDLDPEVKGRVVGQVMGELGWNKFFGFLESAGTSNEHFHFQRKHGTAYTIHDLLTD